MVRRAGCVPPVDHETQSRARRVLRSLWPEVRLGVIVGVLALVLGSVAAFLTSTPPPARGPAGSTVVAPRSPVGRLAAGEHEVARAERLEDEDRS
jgi:hypothetical protein